MPNTQKHIFDSATMRDFRLLLATRLKFYANYVRRHFDRRTIIYIFLIGLIFFYMVLRSPADVGFSLAFLSDPSFPETWLSFWAQTLVLVYIFAFSLTWITLKSRNEGILLGAVPFNNGAVFLYYLSRLWLKSGVVVFGGAALFLLGEASFIQRISLSVLAFFIYALLLLAAFIRASSLLRNLSKKGKMLAGWGGQEAVLLALFAIAPRLVFSRETPGALFSATAAAAVLAGAFFLFQRAARYWTLEVATEATLFSKREKQNSSQSRSSWLKAKSLLGQLILQDFFFLKNARKSLFVWMGVQTTMMLMIAIMNPDFRGVVAGLIFFQCILGFFSLSALTELFKRDAETFFLIKQLPLSAGKLWQARWITTILIIALPSALPVLALLIKFSFSLGALIWGATILAFLPAILAMIFCSAGFSTFPHANYGATMFAISFVLTVLFWFYAPPATVLMIGLFFYWIRKSVRRMKYLEAG